MTNVYSSNGNAAIKVESAQPRLRVIKGTASVSGSHEPQVHMRAVQEEAEPVHHALSEKASRACVVACSIFALFFLSFAPLI